MEYRCPRCDMRVERQDNNKWAWKVGGIAGSLLFSAFAKFVCKKCGKIAKSEFPKDVQKKMIEGSTLTIFIAILIFVIGSLLLAYYS